MRVRALLIVNPRATTTNKPVLDTIVSTLAAQAEIEVVETRYRGDAREIATRAADEGWDAEVVRGVEEERAQGRPASTGLYMRTALRQYYRRTDRRHPELSVTAKDGTQIDPVALAIISNTTPWSYAGQRPVSPTPAASFDTGLDAFLLRRLRTISTLNALRQMARRTGQPVTGKYVVSLHDQAEITVQSRKPVALQVDGDYVGDAESVTFRSVPGALRVIA